MSKCSNCSSTRIAGAGGKTSDMSWFSVGNKDHDGYVPQNVGISEDSDYIEFDYCLDCGTIQGKFPISKTAVTNALKSEC